MREPIKTMSNLDHSSEAKKPPVVFSAIHGSAGFDSPERQLDKFFKALSDETRRGILRLLERRDRTVTEIVDNFNLSQPTISRHLSVLKEARLVLDQRQGQYVIYTLASDTLAGKALAYFNQFQEFRKQNEAG